VSKPADALINFVFSITAWKLWSTDSRMSFFPWLRSSLHAPIPDACALEDIWDEDSAYLEILAKEVRHNSIFVTYYSHKHSRVLV